jgi:hypothetical protein
MLTRVFPAPPFVFGAKRNGSGIIPLLSENMYKFRLFRKKERFKRKAGNPEILQKRKKEDKRNLTEKFEAGSHARSELKKKSRNCSEDTTQFSRVVKKQCTVSR